YDIGATESLLYFSMEYVSGGDLQSRLGEPVSLLTALEILSQVGSALEAAHEKGIVHRDVKPANILVSGAGQRVWITDFGLARAVDDASLTRTGFIAGTPHYMSPEQARGAVVGPSSDLFSLGGVLYFMLSARPPWRAERSLAVLHRIVQETHRPLWQLNPDVPREVSDLVDLLLSKSPEAREVSAVDLQQRLEVILADLQNPVGPHALTVPKESGSGEESGSKGRLLLNKPMALIPLTALLTALLLSLPGGWKTQSALSSSDPSDDRSPVQEHSSLAGPPTETAAPESSNGPASKTTTAPDRPAEPESGGTGVPDNFVDQDQLPAPSIKPRREPDVTEATAGVDPVPNRSNLDVPDPLDEVEPLTPPPMPRFRSTITDECWLEIEQLERMLQEAETTLSVPSPLQSLPPNPFDAYQPVDG
ncbi:MAG: serine/threonine protein kinase, partial [Pirellulales bacterium]|nr:serine/threonine protein kinase [Pirellulales bacterium]